MMETRTIPDALDSTARWFPDDEAFVQGLAGDDRRFTYEEFRNETLAVADAYRTLGVERGDRVVFISDTIVEHAVAYVGAIRRGAIASTLHVREAPNVLGNLVAELDPAAMVFQPKYAETVQAFADDVSRDVRLFAFDHESDVPGFADSFSDLLDAGEPVDRQPSVDPDDPALINYTSGSTGTPKGIVHTHEDVIESAHLAHYSYQARRDDVDLNPFAASFIGWPMHVFTFGSIGATVVFLDEWVPERVPSLIEDEGLTYVILTPTQWKQLLDAGLGDANTSSLDRIGYAGESMSESLFRDLQREVCDRVLAIYGGTEIMNSGSVLFPDEVSPEKLASIGRPAPNVDVRLIDPAEGDPEEEVERGSVGEIIVRGPSVADTVWGDPEATAELFHEDGWWFSGDLGRIRDNGYLYVEGRVDNMIITGGMNVYAEAVEGVLEHHPDVLEAAVIGTDHDEWGTAVKAVIRTPGEDLTADDLEEWCLANDDIANYQRPREYAFVESFPRTSTGKLDRDTLAERTEPGADPDE